MHPPHIDVTVRHEVDRQAACLVVPPTHCVPASTRSMLGGHLLCLAVVEWHLKRRPLGEELCVDVLAEAGSSSSHLLTATIYLRDIDNDFAPMNEVWNAWVPDGHAPARACVQAHMARSTLLVEICVTAAIADR